MLRIQVNPASAFQNLMLHLFLQRQTNEPPRPSAYSIVRMSTRCPQKLESSITVPLRQIHRYKKIRGTLGTAAADMVTARMRTPEKNTTRLFFLFLKLISNWFTSSQNMSPLAMDTKVHVFPAEADRFFPERRLSTTADLNRSALKESAVQTLSLSIQSHHRNGIAGRAHAHTVFDVRFSRSA